MLTIEASYWFQARVIDPSPASGGPNDGPFLSGLNTRTWPQFNARMMPMRANIVGPRNSATSIRLSIAACHSALSASFFGSLVM